MKKIVATASKVAVLALVVMGTPVTAAQSDDPPPALRLTEVKLAGEGPRYAIPIDNDNVVEYGARLRLTRSTWEYMRLVLRDTFKAWGAPGRGEGFNLLLDPGYSHIANTAGPLRTTPLQVFWAYHRGNRYSCTYGECSVWRSTNPATVYDDRDYQLWTQVRPPAPAGENCNVDERAIDPDGGALPHTGNQWGMITESWWYNPQAVQNLNREHAFYVRPGNACWSQFNLCVGDHDDFRIYTPHQHLDPANTTVCDLESTTIAGYRVSFNVGLHIFPNSAQLNATSGDGWVPTRRFWNYTGLQGPWGVRSSGVVDAYTRNCNWWGSCSTGTHSLESQWHASNAPPSLTAYNNAGGATGSFHPTHGTYFRSGDDTSLYLNIHQTQVQSVDRDLAGRPNSCGTGKVYNGSVVNGEPQYFDTDVAQCVRPRMYWNTNSARGPTDQWVPCDPFDTFRQDGTENPTRDDNENVYPGDGSQGTCGRQSDPLSWTDSGGNGTGWYGMRLNYLNVIPDSHPDPARANSIEIELEAPDVRLEVGMWLDANTSWYNFWRRWSIGRIRIESLKIRARIKLYSIDDASCTAGQACDSPWTLTNDGMLSPDRLIVDVQINDEDVIITLDDPNYIQLDGTPISLFTFETVANWVLPTLTDTIAGVMAPLITDTLGEFTGSIPPLNAMFGDPIHLDQALIHAGIYATGADVDHDGGNPPQWPVRMFDGPIAGQELTDLRMAVGFEPIAFRPADPARSNLIEIDDPWDGILPDSYYGVPTMIDPDTSSCFQAKGTYTYDTLGQGASYSYSVGNGRIENLWLPGNNSWLGATFIDLTTETASELDHYKGVFTSHRYYVMSGRPNSFVGGSYEVTRGRVPVTINDGSITGIDVGAIFRDDTTGKQAVVASVDTTNNVIWLDVASSWIQNSGPDGLSDYVTRANFPGGSFTIANCSRESRYPLPTTDQQFDTDDYVTAGSFYDPIVQRNYSQHDVIQKYFMPPVKKAPAWCISPQEIYDSGHPARLAQLYPQDTWLSFNDTTDLDPRSGFTVPQNTLGNWEVMPGNTVLLQNTNTGALDPDPIPYDFSLHIHQRTFVSFLQAVFASGAACLEFAAEDEDGNRSPFADFLKSDRFAAFVPEINHLYPDSNAIVRISPTKTPHVRVGMGNLNYTSRERIKDPVGGPLPIENEQYTLSVAIPDIRVQILVDVPDAGEVSLLTMYWSPVFGFYTKPVRQCYKLDPLYETDRCDSEFTNVRTISGYNEFFIDMNSESLKQAWENPRDGFTVGQFTNPGVGNTQGSAQFVIADTYCADSERCDMIGLASAIPTLMNSMLQVFFVSRMSLYDFTLDFLYIGPDGPNDDLIGGGDYLGLYARFLGNLDVFGLLGAFGALAPGEDIFPMAQAVNIPEDRWFDTNQPVIQLEFSDMPELEVPTVESYTYRVNQGFWHTPVHNSTIELGTLTEGEHSIEVRSLVDSELGARAQLEPTVFYFRVDTVPPDVDLHKRSFPRSAVEIDVSDLQTPRDDIQVVYAFNQDAWRTLEGPSLSLADLPSGRHELRVRATDLAGNVRVRSEEFTVGGWWGCSTSPTPGQGFSWLALIFGWLLARRRMQRST